jgi:hypothetical protein
MPAFPASSPPSSTFQSDGTARRPPQGDVFLADKLSTMMDGEQAIDSIIAVHQ